MQLDLKASNISTCWPTGSFFECFEPYPVRFDAITVLIVHRETNRMAHLCTDGPTDTISVKSCATVADICQKPDNIAFRCGSQLASQANCWTAYVSLARTKRLSNHTISARQWAFMQVPLEPRKILPEQLYADLLPGSYRCHLDRRQRH